MCWPVTHTYILYQWLCTHTYSTLGGKGERKSMRYIYIYIK